MVGITELATYIPRYRLNGTTLGSVWGSSVSGERAVANHDEDSLTMAVAATLGCLAEDDPKMIDALYFASTSAPYQEKQNATLIATVADLRTDALTVDVGGSLRAATGAMRLAMDAVRAGSAKRVLVAAAETRVGMPGSDVELLLGDAAVAFTIGDADPIATIEGFHSLSYELTDVWRKQGDRYVNQADARFVQLYGYERAMRDAAKGLLDRCELRPEDVSKVVYYAPDARLHRSLARPLGFKDEAYADPKLLSAVGNTGNANALLGLAEALGVAKPGDRIVLVNYGNGADAILLRVTERIAEWQRKPGLEAQLAAKRPLENYGKYLRFRSLVEGETLSPYSSPMLLWRELKQDLQLYGLKCRQCGAIQYPARRVCWKCGTKDAFDDVKLSRRGKVFTHTSDYLVPTPDPPVTMVTVDLEGGGRFYAQLTDCDPNAVAIGMTVELTFRKYHEGQAFNNYFWKFRPVF